MSINIRQRISESLPLLSWFLLAVGSGMVNTGSFLACQRFVSHVTGFGTMAGISMGNCLWLETISMISVPLYFLLGCMFSAWLTDRRIHQGRNPLYSVPLLVVTALLAAVAIAGHYGLFGGFGRPFRLALDYPPLVLLCLASGLQNAVVTTATGSILRCSHLTGTTTDLGMSLVRTFLMPRGSIERRLEMRLSWMRLGSVCSFVIGAMAGAIAFTHWHYLAFTIPAGFSLVVAIRVALQHK